MQNVPLHLDPGVLLYLHPHTWSMCVTRSVWEGLGLLGNVVRMTGSSTTTCSEAAESMVKNEVGRLDQNNTMTWSSDDDRVIHDDLFRGRE